MVIERVEILTKPGQQAEFERAMVRGRELLSAAAGCNEVALARGVENPDKYLLTLRWDSVQSHIDFTSTPGFSQFRELAGPFFAEKPAMEHFAPV